MLMIFNKIDLYRQRNFDAYVDKETQMDILRELSAHLKNQFEFENVFVSATGNENIEHLRTVVKAYIARCYEERYPYITKKW